MNNFKKILSLFLVLVMCMGILPSTALAATNSKGMTYSASANVTTLETSDATQKVVVSVKANQKFPVDAIGMTVIIPEGWSLEAIENEDLTFAPSNLNLEKGKVNYVTSDAENWSTDWVAKITYIVPANVAAGDYNLGIKDLVISEDYGTVWENGGTATATVTVKGATVPDPGAIAYSAKLDVTSIDTSASTQKVVVSVKANQKFPVDAIGMTVIIPEGWSLEAIENEDLTFAPSNLNLEKGKVNYVTSDAENWSTDWVAKITYIVPANVAAGDYNLGIKDLVISKDYGTVWENGGTATATLTVKGAPVHTCSGTFTKGQAATCTVDGWNDYYTCSCGKYYSDSACNNEITDLTAWKKGAGKIAASHDYGTLVDEDPGKHTATEVKDGMKAHYFCDTCDTYFDSSKVATTKEALTIKNQHSYTTQYGYKEDDGHADTCSCGAHNTVVGHTANIPAPTEDDDQVCKYCGFVIATKTGHIHQNNLTPVSKLGATCTDDGYKAHYKCSCGKYFEDASASVEITDIDAWKAGAGKIAAEGHKYTEQKKDTAHLKTEATNCTEFDVYWYDCSVCDANAKNDPNATDKFWTSTDAGEHKFDEKLTDAAHLVAGTGANCQDAKKYYYDCAYCATMGTTTWTSTTYGDHSFTEKLADAAHLVAGTGANCQDVKEYYYDCAHCAEIGTTTWASTEVGDHEFDTTQWGYKDKATGHAHKCKYCNEHDAVQPHTPNMGAPTETEDKICTACQIVLETATGHICKSHLTKVPANGASCTVDGNIEYYECSCGKYYTDSTASVEITDKASVVIEAGHNYGTEWKSDKDNHWNECACGDKANSAAHKDENSDGKCDVCQYNVGTPGGSTGDDKPSDNPQTGDNSNMVLWISLLMISALGVVATTILGKKKYSVK